MASIARAISTTLAGPSRKATLGNSTEIFTAPMKYVARMVDISGRCDAGFGAVKDAFAENFDINGDVGASVAVTIGGEPVVDLWGGTQDAAGEVPWEEDTIINVFSTTKTMCNI